VIKEIKKRVSLMLLLCAVVVANTSCADLPEVNAKTDKPVIDEKVKSGTEIHVDGKVIHDRFGVPDGFERTFAEEGSFDDYLRSLPLRPHGSVVRTYSGGIKMNRSAYEAVVDLDIGDKNLQQCADAVMRLRGEHQFSQGLFDQISFRLTNGFEVPYVKWRDGWRIKVEGNDTSWVKNATPDESYESFRKYMEFVFIYAGTLSLDRDLVPVSFEDMKIGDVLVQGGSPGHAVIVVDMAENPDTGEKIFMLAQSYMPAQDIHVLSNPNDESISPWYGMEFEGELVTPEWTFGRSNLKRFN